MKKIERLLLEACAYSTFILFFFLLFTLPESDKIGGVTLGTFLLILMFGIVISLAGGILKLKDMKLRYKILIHFPVLFIAFCTVFMLSGNLWIDSPGSVFSAVFIFAFLYALTFGVFILIKKFVAKADRKLDKSLAKKREENEKKKAESAYKPLYKKN